MQTNPNVLVKIYDAFVLFFLLSLFFLNQLLGKLHKEKNRLTPLTQIASETELKMVALNKTLALCKKRSTVMLMRP